MKPQTTSMTSWGILISLLEAVVDRAADHLERVGSIVDDTSREIFNREPHAGRPPVARAPIFQELVEKIGEEGDFTSKMRESLVSIGRHGRLHDGGARHDESRRARSRTIAPGSRSCSATSFR